VFGYVHFQFELADCVVALCRVDAVGQIDGPLEESAGMVVVSACCVLLEEGGVACSKADSYLGLGEFDVVVAGKIFYVDC